MVGVGMLGRQCKGSGETCRACASTAGVRARVVAQHASGMTYRCGRVQTGREKPGWQNRAEGGGAGRVPMPNGRTEVAAIMTAVAQRPFGMGSRRWIRDVWIKATERRDCRQGYDRRRGPRARPAPYNLGQSFGVDGTHVVSKTRACSTTGPGQRGRRGAARLRHDGGKWYSLMDKVFAPKTLMLASWRSTPTA